MVSFLGVQGYITCGTYSEDDCRDGSIGMGPWGPDGYRFRWFIVLGIPHESKSREWHELAYSLEVMRGVNVSVFHESGDEM